MISATRSIAAARSKAERAAQEPQASFAAFMARLTSPRVPWGTVPIFSPVAGLVASIMASDSEPVHLPATYMG